MSETTIYMPNQISVPNVTFSDVRKGQKSKMVFVNHPNPQTQRGERITMQTPRMRLPFGISTSNPDDFDDKIKEADPEKTTYKLQMSFWDAKENPKVASFENLLESLDNTVINAGAQNSVEWFGEKRSRDIVAFSYTPTHVVNKKKPEYAPMARFTIPSYKGKINVDVYDEDQNLIPSEDVMKVVEKGADVIAIVELAKIYFAPKFWGMQWKVVQMQVFNPRKIKGFAIQGAGDGFTAMEIDSHGTNGNGTVGNSKTPVGEDESDNDEYESGSDDDSS